MPAAKVQYCFSFEVKNAPKIVRGSFYFGVKFISSAYFDISGQQEVEI